MHQTGGLCLTPNPGVINETQIENEDFQGFINREKLIPDHMKMPFDRSMVGFHKYLNEMMKAPKMPDYFVPSIEAFPGMIIISWWIIQIKT